MAGAQRARGLSAALVVLALLAMALLGARALGTTGDPDPSFSKDGIAKVSLPYYPPAKQSDDFTDLALQPDGKPLLVGETGEESPYHRDVVVARFNTNGALDTGFGKKGTALIRFPDPNNPKRDDIVFSPSVAVAPNGKILIVGSSCCGHIDLARLNPNGSFDRSFSGDGSEQVTLPGLSNQSADDLALLGDGRMVIGGTSRSSSGTYLDFLVARFSADGALDPSFSGDGFATTDLGGDEAVHEVALQPDGSVVAAGGAGSSDAESADSRLAVVRYTPTGDLDPTFSGDGIVISDAANIATGVTIDGSGRIAVTAANRKSEPTFTVARFTPAGELDAEFGSGGFARLSFGVPSRAFDLVAAANGSLSVVGTVATGGGGRFTGKQDFAIGRLSADGKPDRAFSRDGKQVTDLGCKGSEGASSAAMDAKGRILAAGDCMQAGTSIYAAAFAVVRYEAGRNR